MSLIFHFFLGLIVSYIGSLHPGMITLNMVDTAIRRSFREAAKLAAAATTVEIVQAFVAILFTGFFIRHPVIERAVQIGAIPLFLLLGVYFLVRHQKTKAGKRDKLLYASSYKKGFVLGALNTLPIPYWIFMSSYFATNHWMDYSWPSVTLLTIGIGCGTFLSLLTFARLSILITNKIEKLNRMMDKIIGFIFLGLAVFQLIKVVV